jgi:hypothetical protein
VTLPGVAPVRLRRERSAGDRRSARTSGTRRSTTAGAHGPRGWLRRSDDVADGRWSLHQHPRERVVFVHCDDQAHQSFSVGTVQQAQRAAPCASAPRSSATRLRPLGWLGLDLAGIGSSSLIRLDRTPWSRFTLVGAARLHAVVAGHPARLVFGWHDAGVGTQVTANGSTCTGNYWSAFWCRLVSRLGLATLACRLA